MSCTRTRRLLDAWLDDELDPSTHAQIAGHFARCLPCAARRSARAELREAIRAADLRERAPPSFASEVRRALANESAGPAVPRSKPSWWIATAMACLGALAGALAMFAWLQNVGVEVLPGVAVTRHVAALAMAEGRAEGLVQVAASDRHVVKPWFQGKVDFAPPVRDLASEGFALLGGRLDRIGARAAAVVVYRIRNHPVDLFVWRSDGAPTPMHVAVDRGFSVAVWAEQGLRFAAVSDVDPRDLERFARATQSGIGQTASP